MTPADIMFVSGFQELAKRAHATARQSGFWDTRDKIQAACDAVGIGSDARKCIDSQLRELIHSELSEACEGERKDLADDHLPRFTMQEAELADAIVRIMDLSEARGLRVAEALVTKMEFNATRPRMHGGKKF